MSRDRSQIQCTDRSQRLVSQMTLFLIWWTNKHTCTPEETVCHCPVACCVTVQFALPNPTGTGKDGIPHYCPLPYTRNQGDRVTGNELRLVSDSRWESCLLFVEFYEKFVSHSQHRHTDTVLTIPMSRPNVHATRRGFVTACQACKTNFYFIRQREIWLFQ